MDVFYIPGSYYKNMTPYYTGTVLEVRDKGQFNEIKIEIDNETQYWKESHLNAAATTEIPYTITHKTCRICAISDGDTKCSTCSAYYHTKCTKHQNQCNICRGLHNQQDLETKQQSTHIDQKTQQTNIPWEKKEQSTTNQPPPRKRPRQNKTTRRCAYYAERHNNMIHIYRQTDNFHRISYKPLPRKPAHKGKLISTQPVNMIQHGEMTRNPTQQERQQQQQRAGGGGRKSRKRKRKVQQNKRKRGREKRKDIKAKKNKRPQEGGTEGRGEGSERRRCASGGGVTQKSQRSIE